MELEGGFETWKENQLDIEEDSTHRYKTTVAQQMTSRH